MEKQGRYKVHEKDEVVGQHYLVGLSALTIAAVSCGVVILKIFKVKLA